MQSQTDLHPVTALMEVWRADFNPPSKRRYFQRGLYRCRLIWLVGMTLGLLAGNFVPALAQEGAGSERPFQLPFAQPPSPDTWLMAQPYGNTTGAYRQRFSTYGASGGIHFGLDLSAPCGTEIVAMADGIVFAVDGPFGSPPHNLMIDHPQLGYATMYGHLLQVPNLVPGQQVKQGEVIALTGDTAETCYGRPHLHLEIRDLAHIRKYNPQLLIEANWDNQMLYGNAGRDFARDLTEPRKWQTLYDQPEVQTGGPIVNDFAYPWPFEWEQGLVLPPKPAAIAVAAALESPVSDLRSTALGRQVSAGDCCTQFYWKADSTAVRFLDQPGSTAPLGLWEVPLAQAAAGPQLVTERLGYYSPDGALMAYPDPVSGLTVLERLADGQTWSIDTQGRSVSFTPDSRQIIWTVFDENAASDNREETIWQAEIDGANRRAVFSARRTSAVAWLSSEALLIARRLPGGSNEQLFELSLATGEETFLTETPRMRGLSLSPDRRYLIYYVSREPAAAGVNGTWLLDLRQPATGPRRLPFFGAYRWRDNQHLVYVPFDPEATEHNFYEYNVIGGQSRLLFPTGTGLTIANNEWQISPDGQRLALLAAQGTGLDGIWVLELP